MELLQSIPLLKIRKVEESCASMSHIIVRNSSSRQLCPSFFFFFLTKSTFQKVINSITKAYYSLSIIVFLAQNPEPWKSRYYTTSLRESFFHSSLKDSSFLHRILVSSTFCFPQFIMQDQIMLGICHSFIYNKFLTGLNLRNKEISSLALRDVSPFEG